ncbi:hypothetical protein DH09_05700 [Bacillaceae bacterium JMAK1]|nr:hypothetical protein DH09_05700 [Bacillaceae bacterium JMAK1]
MFDPHDLLKINVNEVLKTNSNLPHWANCSLQKSPYVVVRRGAYDRLSIPVGVRGKSRNERYAMFVSVDQVVDVFTPYQLRTLSSTRLQLTKAQDTFETIKQLWKSENWGPTGSVGFELATGTKVMREQSDFDILIQSEFFSVPVAKEYVKQLQAAPMTVDPLIQTKSGWFSLKEYALGKGVLFKTMTGLELRTDPWSNS